MATGGSGSTGSSSDTSGNSAAISSNDFLTLLVTEMQNQDPTAATDPNEYINQLVNVNSLEQLISINQNLSTALGSSTTASSDAKTGVTAASEAQLAGKSVKGAVPKLAGTGSHAGVSAGIQSAAGTAAGAKLASGNLSVPEATPAAHRVAGALSGRIHAHPATGQF
jgi:flagellar basal-body rod modification protein FlgD